MKDFDVRVFESNVSDKAFIKIQEELNKNSDFQINNDNITEFVDCKFIIDILKDENIEYKIVVNDQWTQSGFRKGQKYNLIVGIYISQKDYALIKHIFEQDMIEDDEYYDLEEDDTTKRISLAGYIFMNITLFMIGIPFFILGIKFINTDIATAIVFMIIGGGIVIHRIIEICKQINEKNKKKLKKDEE